MDKLFRRAASRRQADVAAPVIRACARIRDRWIANAMEHHGARRACPTYDVLNDLSLHHLASS
jgi:hypothetical protein